MKKYKKRWDKLDNYYRKQKRLGAIMILLAVLSTILLNDCTAGILIVIPGVYAVFTKDLVIYDDDIEELRELKRNRWKGL